MIAHASLKGLQKERIMNRLFSIGPSKGLLFVTGFLALANMLAANSVGTDLTLVAAISLGCFAIGFLGRKDDSVRGHTCITIGMIGQCVAFTAAFQGHPWQIDTHMLFFAGLATLIALRSITAILVATAFIALHHLSLSVLMPVLIYPDASMAANLGRTVLHAAIVLLESAILIAVVLQLKQLTNETASRESELEQLMAENEAARAASDKERETVIDVVRTALSRLEAGDLSTQMDDRLPDGYGDIQASFDRSVDQLNTLVIDVMAQTADMEEQIREFVSASGELAHRTERQAFLLSHSSDGLTAMAEQVSGTETEIQNMNDTVARAQSNARRSETVLSSAAEAMTSISEGSEEIAQIVSLIEDISFQTNLLALNAGVEAARAGESGRGFAVVASEVGALAQRSANNSDDIKDLIGRSSEHVEAGTSRISDTVRALTDVLSGVIGLADRMDGIMTRTSQQTQGIKELNQSVSELENVTQENAALSEETAAAGTQLLESAGALKALTQTFTTIESRKSEDLAA